MKNGITNRQMFFLILLTITTFSSLNVAQIIAQTAGRAGWIPILAQTLLFGVAAGIITKLNGMHKGKALFEYGTEVAGKGVAIAMTVFYIVYFLIIGAYLHINLVQMVKSNFLRLTPVAAMLIMGIPVFAYTANKGITNVARLFEIIGFLFLVIIVALCVAMTVQGYPDHILPLFSRIDLKSILPAMKRLVIPYGGLAILLVIPLSSGNRKPARVAVLSVFTAGILYLLIVESVIMVLGLNNTMLYNDAFIEAIRVVDIPVLERPDLAYLVFGLSSLFAGLIVIYTIIAEHGLKLLPKAGRGAVLAVIGVVFFAMSLLSTLIRDLKTVFERFFPLLEIVSSFVIPAVLLVLSRAKAAKAKRQAA